MVDAQERAFPFVTLHGEGFPHAALLSRAELEAGPGRADVRPAVRSRRTRANLDRDGRTTLFAVAGTPAHYVKLRLVRSVGWRDLLACVFEVAEHKADSLGIELTPITYRVVEEIARGERWDVTTEALRRLDEES